MGDAVKFAEGAWPNKVIELNRNTDAKATKSFIRV